MGEGLPGWDDEERDVGQRRRRTRPWVLVLAVVPWLVVLGLVWTGAVSGGRATPAPQAGHGGSPAPEDAKEDANEDATARPPAGREEHGATSTESPATGDLPTAPGTQGAPRNASASGTPGPGHPQPHETTGAEARRLGAVALAVARAWLTDVGPRLELEGVEPRTDLYLEHGVVERIERHGDHAVVGILAVVLVRDGETYARVEPRRLAVPLALGPPARPAGAPWWLGEVDLGGAPPTSLVEEEDPAVLLQISEALTAAGLLDGEVLGVERTEDGWWLARTTDEQATDPPTPLWLRPGADGPVVAGLAAGGHGDEYDPEE